MKKMMISLLMIFANLFYVNHVGAKEFGLTFRNFQQKIHNSVPVLCKDGSKAEIDFIIEIDDQQFSNYESILTNSRLVINPDNDLVCELEENQNLNVDIINFKLHKITETLSGKWFNPVFIIDEFQYSNNVSRSEILFKYIYQGAYEVFNNSTDLASMSHYSQKNNQIRRLISENMNQEGPIEEYLLEEVD